MADNISSASTSNVTSDPVPAAVHDRIVNQLHAYIAELEADAKKLWTGKSVYVAFVVGLILGGVLEKVL